MERDDRAKTAGLIELGSVSIETKGPMGDTIEHVGFWQKMGISPE